MATPQETANGHHWIERFNLVCCRDCGFVRRADDQNKPCRGVVKVALRETADLAVSPQKLGVGEPVADREWASPSTAAALAFAACVQIADDTEGRLEAYPSDEAKAHYEGGFEDAANAISRRIKEVAAQNAAPPDHTLPRADPELPPQTRGTAEAVEWCQPMDCGKPTPRRFMIYFEDPDHGIMVFDNEAEARAAFERKNTAWNCYLFGALPLNSPTPPAPHRPVTDERALDLARRILATEFTTEEAAIEIMMYATDAIEQERRHDAATPRDLGGSLAESAD